MVDIKEDYPNKNEPRTVFILSLLQQESQLPSLEFGTDSKTGMFESFIVRSREDFRFS